MKGCIQTISGWLKPEELGWCQCHEHIFLEKCKSAEVSPSLLMDDFEKSLAELKDYKAAGGCSIVDAQPAYSGRMAEYLFLASQRSGVNIIASTGFHKTIFYYADSPIFEWKEQKIANFFTDEIENAMAGDTHNDYESAGSKAGIIKIAADTGGIYADAVYTKLFEAAAWAAQITGAPVMTHIEKGADALEVVKFFEERNIAPERLILCHLDRAKYDFDYHKEVAETGAFLEDDTINRLKYHDNKTEAELILYMLEQGFKDRLLMSLDTTNQRLRHYGADMGLDYILNDFAPYLKSLGVREEDISDIMIKNPSRALQFVK